MDITVLTQYGGKILGPIAKWVLGPILNGIFVVLDWIHLPNVGVAIILFTIAVYLLLLPLTIKQQKFSKLQAKMQPELQAIQNKYKGKKDQESQMAMNQETQAVYAKYGVSPMGSCLQLLIQMPILFALYRVIYSIPAYVTKIGKTFGVLAAKIISTDNAAFLRSTEISGIAKAVAQFSKNLDKNLSNGIVDVLNTLSSSDMEALSSHYGLADLTYEGHRIFSGINAAGDKVRGLLDQFNTFLGINIINSPSYTIKTAFESKAFLLMIGAILIPVLAAVTQWISVKLAPSPSSSNNGNDSMQSSMKAMNVFMPIFSAVICFTLPVGLGIYWIAGAVVRSIEQILINKHIDKIDLEAEIKKNVEKRNAKLRKAGIDPDKLMRNASISTKAMAVQNSSNASLSAADSEKRKEEMRKATEYYNKKNGESAGSIAAKANMVKQYNEKNNEK